MRTRKGISKSSHASGHAILIVCRRRKSQPQMLPVVCEKRCPHIKNCPSYRDYIQPGLFDLPRGRGPKGK